MNVGFYSYAISNLNPDVIFYQKKVFDKFNLSLTQLISENDHAFGLSQIIKQSKEDYLVIFDIDCIPLSFDFFDLILKDIHDHNTLAGAIGCANHKNPNKLYVHPCFMAFSKRLYFECGSPSLEEYEDGDVAQKFTDVCLQKNKNVKYWELTDSIDKIWELKPLNIRFGHGSIYRNLIYHQYQIRMQSQQKCFINKCIQILSL